MLRAPVELSRAEKGIFKMKSRPPATSQPDNFDFFEKLQKETVSLWTLNPRIKTLILVTYGPQQPA